MTNETTSRQNEKKFEVLTYLELTSAALEEGFNSINEKKYDIKIKKSIDDELGAFYKLCFKNKVPSNNLTNTGKYVSALIGKNLIQEKSSEKRMEAGLKYLLDNLGSITSEEYEKLGEESLRKLSGFFEGLVEIATKEADKISLYKGLES